MLELLKSELSDYRSKDYHQICRRNNGWSRSFIHEVATYRSRTLGLTLGMIYTILHLDHKNASSLTRE